MNNSHTIWTLDFIPNTFMFIDRNVRIEYSSWTLCQNVARVILNLLKQMSGHDVDTSDTRP